MSARFDEEDLFGLLRSAFLRGESWRRRNGLSEDEGSELVAKAANDFADNAVTVIFEAHGVARGGQQ